MKDYYQFLKLFLSKPTVVGSIFPSSKKLAQCMSEKISYQDRKYLRFLEIGAGSGALTKHIVSEMQLGDTLDLLELNPQFCKILRRKYSHIPNINIYECSLLNFEQKDYDFIISSLPLNSFSSYFVDQVFLKYKSLIRPGGYLSYFEYIGLSKIKKLYLSKGSHNDFVHTLSLKSQFITHHATQTNKIWWNLPPARVFHCKM